MLNNTTGCWTLKIYENNGKLCFAAIARTFGCAGGVQLLNSVHISVLWQSCVGRRRDGSRDKTVLLHLSFCLFSNLNFVCPVWTDVS